jgi:hypothetical protein
MDKGITKNKKLSVSGKHQSIKSLVEFLLEKTDGISFEAVFKIVSKEYPNSKFNKKHFVIYKVIYNKAQNGQGNL